MSRHSGRLPLVLLAALLAFLLGEGLARVTVNPEPRVNFSRIPASITTASRLPGLTYVLRPGSEVAVQAESDPRGYLGPERSLTYRVNSLGFRGPETTKEKPGGVFRILGLGDSFTFGSGVRVEDTFLARLEGILAGNGLRPSEVLNLGVMGYNTPEEVSLLRHVGVGLDPDLVLICFFLNDTGEGGGTVGYLGSTTRSADLPWWRRASVLLDLLVRARESRAAEQRMIASYERAFEDAAPGWRAVQAALVDAARLSEQHQFRLALVLFPVLWRLDAQHPFSAQHVKVARFAESLGIPVLDLLPAFLGQEGPDLWVHPGNQHPNEIGHRIAADALHRFLVTHHLLE